MAIMACFNAGDMTLAATGPNIANNLRQERKKASQAGQRGQGGTGPMKGITLILLRLCVLDSAAVSAGIKEKGAKR